MIQIFAILQDSLRLLLSRKLFWLSLGLSVLASVALFGLYTFNEQGIRFLWFDTFKNPMLRASSDGPRLFVSGLFNEFYVRFWLAWAAIILAIISTASVLPEFLSGGSIELSLSKPISRLTLYSAKVLGSLLFVFAQTSVGVGAAVLLLGFLHGLWLPNALLAIPFITLQFFYLYSFSALLAVITRSTLACLLGTAVFWFLIFLVQFASNRLDEVAAQGRARLEREERRATLVRAQFEENNRDPTPLESAKLLNHERVIKDQQNMLDSISPWRQSLNIAKLIVPKTGDVQTIVANVTGAPNAREVVGLFETEERPMRPRHMSEEQWDDIREVDAAGKTAIRNISAAKSLGSSAGISLVIFGLGALIFARRDF